MNILNKAFLISFLLLTSEGKAIDDGDVAMADADLVVVPVILNRFFNIERVNLNNNMAYHDLKILIADKFGMAENEVSASFRNKDLDLDSNDRLDIARFQVEPEVFVF